MDSASPALPARLVQGANQPRPPSDLDPIPPRFDTTTMPLDDRLKSLLTVALDDARQRLETEFDAQFEDVRQAAERRLDEARAEADRMLAEARAEADRAREEAQRSREEADRTLADAREQAERLRAEAAEQARQQQEAAVHAAVTAARAESNEAVRAMAERTRTETEALIEAAVVEATNRATGSRDEAMAVAGVREREAHMSGASRVLESVRALARVFAHRGAGSAHPGGDAGGRSCGRARFARRPPARLEAGGLWRPDAAPRQVDLAVVDAGVIGAAVASSQPATTRESDGAGGPHFAALPADRMGLAVPVTVGGRVVAVVYADSARGAEHAVVPSPWPEMVELLARHAARCLEALTVQKVGNPAAKAASPSTVGRPA